MDTGGFTQVERVLIAHACEDYAGNWYGQQGAFTWGRSDCERYVSEGHLGKLCDRYSLKAVWAAVRVHLDGHPEILAAGRLTDVQRDANKAARDARAKALIDQAEQPFRDGRWDDAFALIDRAELASPGYDNFEVWRRIVRERAARATV